jgi:transcription elongation factor B subunit 1
VVEKVIEYLTYKAAYANLGPKEDLPDFMERLPPELALEL